MAFIPRNSVHGSFSLAVERPTWSRRLQRNRKKGEASKCAGSFKCPLTWKLTWRGHFCFYLVLNIGWCPSLVQQGLHCLRWHHKSAFPSRLLAEVRVIYRAPSKLCPPLVTMATITDNSQGLCRMQPGAGTGFLMWVKETQIFEPLSTIPQDMLTRNQASRETIRTWISTLI